jgi:hypothetical protein
MHILTSCGINYMMNDVSDASDSIYVCILHKAVLNAVLMATIFQVVMDIGI